jgi:glutathione S-transferase
MKLHATPNSSFARKIRVLLLEKKVAHEVEMLNLWEPNELKKTTPIAKVPALALDDGRVLINSSLIADYLDDTYPSPRFIPPASRFEVRRWEAIADGAMDAVGLSLYEARFHNEATISQAWLDWQREKIDGGFSMLEKMLGARNYCVGDAITLADIAIACHVGFIVVRAPRFFAPEQYPNLTRLWKSIESRDSMPKTAPK